MDLQFTLNAIVYHPQLSFIEKIERERRRRNKKIKKNKILGRFKCFHLSDISYNEIKKKLLAKEANWTRIEYVCWRDSKPKKKCIRNLLSSAKQREVEIFLISLCNYVYQGNRSSR